MQKFDVQIALEGVRDARLKWGRARRKFDTDVDKALDRLIHEAAANYMSVQEFSRHSKMTVPKVRDLMRRNRLDPRDGKTLLSQHAAEALATNSELLGIAPHEMDLMSPLAYLPMGSELRQALTDKAVSRVTEIPAWHTPEQLAEKLTDAGVEYDDAFDWIRDIERAAVERAVSGNRTELIAEVDRLQGLVTYYEFKYNEAHDVAPA